MVITNWKTIKKRLDLNPRFPLIFSLFRMNIVLNEDIKNAGYNPVRTAIMSIPKIKDKIVKWLLNKSKTNSLLIISLNLGRNNSVRISAKINEMAEITTDSPINCFIRSPFPAPFTLRIPISFARRLDRAVERLMKLIIAMIKVRIADIEKSNKYCILPCLQ